MKRLTPKEIAELTPKAAAILGYVEGNVDEIQRRNEDYKRLNSGNGLPEYEAILVKANTIIT